MLLLIPLQVHPCSHRCQYRAARWPAAVYQYNRSICRAHTLLHAKRRGSSEDDLYDVKLDGEDDWQVVRVCGCG